MTSYAPAQSTYSTASLPPQNASQYPASAGVASYAQTPSTQTATSALEAPSYTEPETADAFEPVKRPGLSLKKRLQIGSAIGVATFIIIYTTFFYLYKGQLNENDAASRHDDSILDTIHGATVQPVINLLQPAFDKTIRLSAAVQPLLYELNLRDTLPENVYTKSQKDDVSTHQNYGKIPNAGNTSPVNAIEHEASLSDQDAAKTPPLSDLPSASNSQAVDASRETAGNTSTTGSAEVINKQAADAAADNASTARADTNALTQPSPETEIDRTAAKTAHPSSSKKALIQTQNGARKKKLGRRSKPMRKNKARLRKAKKKRRIQNAVAQNRKQKSRQIKQDTPAPQPKSAKQNRKKQTQLGDDPLGVFNL
jgi:hypothetical protein